MTYTRARSRTHTPTLTHTVGCMGCRGRATVRTRTECAIQRLILIKHRHGAVHRAVCGLVVDYRQIGRPESAIQRLVLSKHRAVRRAVRRAVHRVVHRAVCQVVVTLHHADEQTLVSCWVRKVLLL